MLIVYFFSFEINCFDGGIFVVRITGKKDILLLVLVEIEVKKTRFMVKLWNYTSFFVDNQNVFSPRKLSFLLENRR